MNRIKDKAGKQILVVAAALASFALVALFSTRSPGSAQTVYAESPSQAAVPADTLTFLEGMQKANRAISAALLPSVVTLDVTETQTVQNSPLDANPWFFFGNPQDNQNGQDGQNGQTPQREYNSEGLGSGFIVRHVGKTWYLLTNHHVAGTASKITVRLDDGREFEGKLVGSDERKDIALVSFESTANDIPIVNLGDSDTVKTGDIVFAIGSPLGYMSSVTQGIVSAVGRDGGPNNNINDFIQTDAAINQGNSGGPLVNIYGEVVGINSWIASQSGGSQGLGFSIPINNVKKAIDDFIANGKIRYGWLGVSLVDADQETLGELGLAGRKGALASQVFSNSPAAKGGILPGDFVIALNGRDVKSVDQLVRDVGDLPAGKAAAFRVIRDGKERDLQVKIEERDENTVTDSSKLWPGFVPYALTSDVRTRLNLDAKQKGVLVANVQAKSPASVMGLLAGDVIVKMNDKKVSDLSGFYAQLASAKGDIWFEVLRDGQTVTTMKYKK